MNDWSLILTKQQKKQQAFTEDDECDRYYHLPSAVNACLINSFTAIY